MLYYSQNTQQKMANVHNSSLNNHVDSSLYLHYSSNYIYQSWIHHTLNQINLQLLVDDQYNCDTIITIRRIPKNTQKNNRKLNPNYNLQLKPRKNSNIKRQDKFRLFPLYMFEKVPSKKLKVEKNQNTNYNYLQQDLNLKPTFCVKGNLNHTFYNISEVEKQYPQIDEIKMFSQFPIIFQLVYLNQQKQQQAQQKNQIQIINNSNQKIKVLIHTSLLKSNSAVKQMKKKNFLQSLINPINIQARDRHFKLLYFKKQYKTGYAPVQLQMQGEQQQILKQSKDQKKQPIHFIKKKKQSTFSLPRTCGVSYIKQSQSTHTHLPKLPPLIYQCSSQCASQGNILNDQLINNFLLLPMIVVRVKQNKMRDLLLGKILGEILYVEIFLNIVYMFEDGQFLLACRGRKCSQSDMIKLFIQSEIKFGFLIKKGTNGRKALLKSIGFQDQIIAFPNNNSEQSIDNTSDRTKNNQQNEIRRKLQQFIPNTTNVPTLTIKFQLYVEQKKWKKYSKITKNTLTQLAIKLKNKFQKFSLKLLKQKIQKQKEKYCIRIFKQEIKNTHIDSEICQLFNMQQLINQKNKSSNTQQIPQKEHKLPLYYINTRDSFAYDLFQQKQYFQLGKRKYSKTTFFFDPDNLPLGYQKGYKQWNYKVGITIYNDYFTQQQLSYFQNKIFQTQIKGFKNHYLPMTVQPTVTLTKIRRTKFFFGYRYMWSKSQIAEPYSYVGAGVRSDVSPTPLWLKKIYQPLVQAKIVEKGFINSIALNVYHDGKQGLAQHFDDAIRFRQPIYSVRLFSDARLSFGSQFYGFCNGAFIIPLLRGCIGVMEQGSYAANGVKHCVRPCDMTGKSGAVILRQMHSQVVSQAQKYDELIDYPNWFSTLSVKEGMSYSDQKNMQAQCLQE